MRASPCPPNVYASVWVMGTLILERQTSIPTAAAARSIAPHRLWHHTAGNLPPTTGYDTFVASGNANSSVPLRAELRRIGQWHRQPPSARSWFAPFNVNGGGSGGFNDESLGKAGFITGGMWRATSRTCAGPLSRKGCVARVVTGRGDLLSALQRRRRGAKAPTTLRSGDGGAMAVADGRNESMLACIG